jgi:hypothetical protein
MAVVFTSSGGAFTTWGRRLSLVTLAAASVFVQARNVPVVASSAAHSETQALAASDTGFGSIAPGWSLNGAWTGVAAEENFSTFYALGRGGRCVELDAGGKIVRDFALRQENGSLLRLAHVAGASRVALLAFSVSGKELHAYAVDGTRLWSYPESDSNDAINDVWAASISGFKADQVIVGYNGSAGLHVLTDQGRLLWKTTEIGNVWHVAAGDLWGFGGTQVVTTSAAGLVHVFREGGRSPSIRLPVERVPPAPIVPPTYATMVRVGKAAKTDKAATMFVVGERPFKGQGPFTEHVVALSLVRGKEWTVDLPVKTRSPHVDSAALASGRPWLAVGLRGGRVHLVDVVQGRIIGTIDDQGTTPEVGWAGAGTPTPLLLVATGTKINTYKVATGAASER